MVLAGVKSVGDLAATLDIAGLGQDTLYDALRGKRPIQRHELQAIAEALEMPRAFFEVDDFSGLANGRRQSDDVLHELAETLAGMVERRDEVDERLDRLEDAVDAVLNLIRKDVVPMIGRENAGSTPDASAPAAPAPARRTRAARSPRGGGR